ncbi:NAD-dependent deacetylase [candidate division KSB1 bacterium]|nr:NAD-dependent deacetylase [candidate division KSB1 bacterium]
MKLKDTIKRAADIIEEADALLITAGAGMGVDSGLPDFRGDEGFQKAYPAIAKLGISFAEMANPRWFDHQPKLAWAYYGLRLKMYQNTEPHAGYTTLLEIAEKKQGSYFVFTSNVDGHFQRAGFSDRRIVECQGSIHHLQCVKPCSRDIWVDEHLNVNVNEKIFQAEEPLPVCKHCNQLARPNVLTVGDWNWISDRTDAQDARFEAWLKTIADRGWDLAIVEIGAGSTVATVRYTSERIAQTTNGKLIRINPHNEHVPLGHIGIPLRGLDTIMEIDDIFQTKKKLLGN